MISNAQKAMLHIAKTQLRLADEEYRALLKAEAGVESSTDLDNRGLNRVLKRLARMGFNNTAHRPLRRSPAGMITPEQQQTIEANYKELQRVYAIDGEAAFDTFAKRSGFNRRCCRKAMPQTRGDAIKVIEGQKAILARKTAPKSARFPQP